MLINLIKIIQNISKYKNINLKTKLLHNFFISIKLYLTI